MLKYACKLIFFFSKYNFLFFVTSYASVHESRFVSIRVNANIVYKSLLIYLHDMESTHNNPSHILYKIVSVCNNT